jgi:hypothetical protein
MDEALHESGGALLRRARFDADPLRAEFRSRFFEVLVSGDFPTDVGELIFVAGVQRDAMVTVVDPQINRAVGSRFAKAKSEDPRTDIGPSLVGGRLDADVAEPSKFHVYLPSDFDSEVAEEEIAALLVGRGSSLLQRFHDAGAVTDE